MLVVLTGCPIDPRTVGTEPIETIEPGIEHELTRAGGCIADSVGDLGVVVLDPAASVSLFVRVSTHPVAAADAGGPTDSVYELGLDGMSNPDATVTLQRGSDLLADYCNLGREPQLFESWRAVAGTVEVHVDPGVLDDERGVATIALSDVWIRRKDEPEPDIEIDELVLDPVEVTWQAPG
jgi:hypothetical protein